MAAVTALTPDVGPEEVGFDPARLERLERHLQRLVDSGLLPGALAVVARGGKVASVTTVGSRDPETGLPFEPDTLVRLYSMTKPIASVALMLLYEEGLVSLRDPVAKFIPAFGDARVYRSGPADAPVTEPVSQPMLVEHVLAHTSGLTYPMTMRDPVDEAYRLSGFAIGGGESYTLAEACERWAALPLVFEPGTEWNYGYSSDVAARLVEVISGRPLQDFLAERIFQPLRMVDTGYAIAEEDVPRLAVLYAYDPPSGRSQPDPNATTPTQIPTYMGGGHGLVSTAADYHCFAQMLARGGELDGVRLLAPRTIELMAANHLPGGAEIAAVSRPSFMSRNYPGRGFGLGVAPVIDAVATGALTSRGEYTWGGAAGTDFWVDPAEEITVVFITQVLRAAGELRAELRRLVYQALIA